MSVKPGNRKHQILQEFANFSTDNRLIKKEKNGIKLILFSFARNNPFTGIIRMPIGEYSEKRYYHYNSVSNNQQNSANYLTLTAADSEI